MNRRARRTRSRKDRRRDRPKQGKASTIQDRLHLALKSLQSGRHEETKKNCSRILKSDPTNADALRLMAMAAHASNEADQAVEYLTRLTQVLTDDPGTFAELGALHFELGRYEDAETAYRRSDALAPDNPVTLTELGLVLKERGLVDEALAASRRAVELAPNSATANNGLGLVLESAEAFDEAVVCYRRAQELDPADPSLMENLVNALWSLNRLDEIEEILKRRIAARPGDNDLKLRMAGVLRDQGRLDESRTIAERILERDPNHIGARKCLAFLQFFAEEFEAGWDNFRVRHLDPETRIRRLPHREWRGESLEKKTVLVRGEQGVGDEVCFAGFINELRDLGARPIIECDRRFIPLFERSFGGIDCVARTRPPDPVLNEMGIDFQIMSGDLAARYWPRRDEDERRAPYLTADANLTLTLRQRYGGGKDKQMLVGIAWHSANLNWGPKKSTSLAQWEPILRIPGVRFINLQYGDTESDRRMVETKAVGEIVTDHRIDQMTDLDGFAAQIAAVDLVISVSNSTVHLAGALGVPTWVLVNTVPLWVWGLEGESSALYSSVKLFRQERRGDWAHVIDRVAGELSAYRSRWNAG